MTESPFVRFWRELNAALDVLGVPHAGNGKARDAFEALGASRAIDAAQVIRDAYAAGELEVSPNGTL